MLKKAHAKEIAAHVQEHNRKYNELLQQKMDGEDALQEKFKKDTAKLEQDWKDKLNRAVDETKRVE